MHSRKRPRKKGKGTKKNEAQKEISNVKDIEEMGNQLHEATKPKKGQ